MSNVILTFIKVNIVYLRFNVTQILYILQMKYPRNKSLEKTNKKAGLPSLGFLASGLLETEDGEAGDDVLQLSPLNPLSQLQNNKNPHYTIHVSSCG